MQSHLGGLDFGLIADAELVPDLDALLGHIIAELPVGMAGANRPRRGREAPRAGAVQRRRGNSVAVPTARGRMATDRPERYAKQLTGHWSARGPVTEEDGAVVQRWETGQVLVLRPVEGALELDVSVPEDGDITRFAQVVKEHLERFGRRDELDVVWEA